MVSVTGLKRRERSTILGTGSIWKTNEKYSLTLQTQACIFCKDTVQA
jgi:hypothetical protein